MSSTGDNVKYSDVLLYLNEMADDSQKEFLTGLEHEKNYLLGRYHGIRKLRDGFQDRTIFEHVVDTVKWIKAGRPSEAVWAEMKLRGEVE